MVLQSLYTDSLDKVIGKYFAAVTTKPFTYKGDRYEPQPLRVSPGLFRGYTCPPNCGGCCPRFSLDYLPTEPRPYKLIPRHILVNSKAYVIYSDMQEDHIRHHCANLDYKDGRCNIHGRQPFACDFELTRFSITTEGKNSHMNTRLFGRGWKFLRSDEKTRGAKCEMLPVSNESIADMIRKLKRLRQWSMYFEIPTVMNEIIDWAEESFPNHPLFLNQQFATEATDERQRTLWIA